MFLSSGKKQDSSCYKNNNCFTNRPAETQAFLTDNRHQYLDSQSFDISIRVIQLFRSAQIVLRTLLLSVVNIFEKQCERIKPVEIYRMAVSHLKIDLKFFQSTH
jgi:hypothetical protein